MRKAVEVLHSSFQPCLLGHWRWRQTLPHKGVWGLVCFRSGLASFTEVSIIHDSLGQQEENPTTVFTGPEPSAYQGPHMWAGCMHSFSGGKLGQRGSVGPSPGSLSTEWDLPTPTQHHPITADHTLRQDPAANLVALVHSLCSISLWAVSACQAA